MLGATLPEWRGRGRVGRYEARASLASLASGGGQDFAPGPHQEPKVEASSSPLLLQAVGRSPLRIDLLASPLRTFSELLSPKRAFWAIEDWRSASGRGPAVSPLLQADAAGVQALAGSRAKASRSADRGRLQEPHATQGQKGRPRSAAGQRWSGPDSLPRTGKVPATETLAAASLGCPNDRGASISIPDLTLTPQTPASSADSLSIRTKTGPDCRHPGRVGSSLRQTHQSISQRLARGWLSEKRSISSALPCCAGRT